eukprot:14676.XXX_305974_306213_1 [CDS] Oithona nana genome sequencing.
MFVGISRILDYLFRINHIENLLDAINDNLHGSHCSFFVKFRLCWNFAFVAILFVFLLDLDFPLFEAELVLVQEFRAAHG